MKYLYQSEESMDRIIVESFYFQAIKYAEFTTKDAILKISSFCGIIKLSNLVIHKLTVKK